MTSVIVSSWRSGSSGPKPVTSSIISSTSRVALVAGHREAVRRDHPVDDPLDLARGPRSACVEQRVEGADDLALEDARGSRGASPRGPALRGAGGRRRATGIGTRAVRRRGRVRRRSCWPRCWCPRPAGCVGRRVRRASALAASVAAVLRRATRSDSVIRAPLRTPQCARVSPRIRPNGPGPLHEGNGTDGAADGSRPERCRRWSASVRAGYTRRSGVGL